MLQTISGFKKWYIARSIMCFIRNIIIAGQKNFSSSYLFHPFQASSEYVLSRNFKSKYAQDVNFIEKSPSTLGANYVLITA